MNSVIEKTVAFVKISLENAEAGHDWWHTQRVWHTAKKISAHENTNLLIVELAALLHDIADSKFHNGDDTIGPKKAAYFLNSIEVDTKIITAVTEIITHLSFHKSLDNNNFIPSTEFKIVQDADRLDAIGAIGIARAFHYGGYKNRLLYDPNSLPQTYQNAQAYQKSESPTLNHFYEKLLLLKNTFHTTYARKVAEKRHQLMETFLDNFMEETALELFKKHDL